MAKRIRGLAGQHRVPQRLDRTDPVVFRGIAENRRTSGGSLRWPSSGWSIQLHRSGGVLDGWRRVSHRGGGSGDRAP
jgi:hypothetical protein